MPITKLSMGKEVNHLIKLSEAKKLKVGLGLRKMMADIYLEDLLKGSESKLTTKEEALFKLGFKKGIKYMDVRNPLN
jgi:hypothetical protein